jgi:hypothetical protein
MATEIKNGFCVELRTAAAGDLPKILSLLGRADGVMSSVEFQAACPASATVMRKKLRG